MGEGKVGDMDIKVGGVDILFFLWVAILIGIILGIVAFMVMSI